MEDNYSDDVKTTTVYSNTLSTATSKWSPGLDNVQPLVRSTEVWGTVAGSQNYNDRRGEAEASNNCTENMGKGVWTNANKTHEVRTSTTLRSVLWPIWVAYKHRTWVLGHQLSVRHISRLQPVQAKSCLKQVHRQSSVKKRRFQAPEVKSSTRLATEDCSTVLRTSILLKITRKLRGVQAVRGGVLWED